MENNHFNKILWALFWGSLLVYTVRFMLHSAESILFPYGLDYTEGFALEFVRLLALGETVYFDLTKPPYLIFAYTPIYFFLNSLILDPTAPTFFWGRLFSVCCSLGTVVMVFLCLKNVMRNTGIAILGSLLALTGRYIFRWGHLFRPDPLALFFTFIGLFLFTRKKDNFHLGAAALLFNLAVMTKQNHCFAPFAVLIFLIFYQRERLLFYLISLFGIGLFFLGILEFATEGAFLSHIFRYNLNPFSLFKGLFMGTILFFKHGVLIFIFYTQWRTVKNMNWQAHFLCLYFLVTFIGSLTIGKVGSDTNHYLEFSLSLVLCLALAIHTMLDRNSRKTDPYFFLARILPLLLFFSLIILNFGNSHVAPAYIPDTDEQSHYQNCTQWLAEFGGDTMFSEETSLNVLARKSVDIDPFLVTTLIEQGAIPEQTGLKELETVWFDTILLKFNPFIPEEYNQWHRERMNPRMLTAIQDQYTIVNRFGPCYFSDSRNDNFWFPQVIKDQFFYILQKKQQH